MPLIRRYITSFSLKGGMGKLLRQCLVYYIPRNVLTLYLKVLISITTVIAVFKIIIRLELRTAWSIPNCFQVGPIDLILTAFCLYSVDIRT